MEVLDLFLGCQALQCKGKNYENTVWIGWLGQCIKVVCSASQKLLVVGYYFNRWGDTLRFFCEFFLSIIMGSFACFKNMGMFNYREEKNSA